MSDSSPMQPADPGPMERPSSEPIPPVSTEASSGIAGRWVGPAAMILAAGVVAGLVGWLGGEACRDVIRPRRHPVNSRGIILNVVSPRDQDLADAKNAGLAFAWLGAVLGAGLGAAGGLARHSGRAAIAAAWFGVAMGAVACAAMSVALLPLYNAYRHRNPDEASRDLMFPLLVHAGIWSAAGAAGGAAFGLGMGTRGSMPRAVLGGLAGAAVAAAVYELIGVVAFPDAGTTRFVSSTWPTRLLARLAVGILAAAGVAFAVAPPRERPVTAAVRGGV
jgi:hypothetical protein